MKRPLALIVAAVAIALVGSACSHTTLTDAATIKYKQDGETKTASVTRAELLSEVTKLVKNKPFATWFKQNKFTVDSDVSADTAISAVWLSQLIHQQAIDQLVKSRGVKVTREFEDQAKQDAVNLFPAADIFPAFDKKFQTVLADRQARTEALLASYTDTSDSAAQKYFDAHKDAFACASGRDVAHILVKTEAEAQAIIDQLKGGASFATLAQQKSTDTGSAPQGGSLGCLQAGAFVPEFQTAAETAPFDTPTGPVKSQFGYHVILVTHPATTFEASRAAVQQALAQAGQADAQKSIDAQLKKLDVHVDPRFGTWGLTPNGQGQKVWQITPPKTPNPGTAREGTTTTTATTLPVGAAGGAGTGTP
jgi:parvulin-like peptidyl-prolyl isomerase